jgi:hypothetical protein
MMLVKAQQTVPELVTDRPDQTESSAVVPRKSLQLEAGFVFSMDEDAQIKDKSIIYNTTLLRFGLLDNLELRLGGFYASHETLDKETDITQSLHGFGPLYTGIKVQVARESGLLPEIAFLAGLALPFTANEAFRSSSTAGGMRFSLSHTLSERFSLGYNLGAEWNGDSPAPAYFYSIALGFAISGNAGTYLEFFGLLPEEEPQSHLFDAGFTYLVRPNLQLDVSGGIGLQEEALDYFLGFGVSYRLPR